MDGLPLVKGLTRWLNMAGVRSRIDDVHRQNDEAVKSHHVLYDGERRARNRVLEGSLVWLGAWRGCDEAKVAWGDVTWRGVAWHGAAHAGVTSRTSGAPSSTLTHILRMKKSLLKWLFLITAGIIERGKVIVCSTSHANI